MKRPLLITFTLFLITCCVYSGIRPNWSLPQYFLNVLCGIGQSGPLSLIVAVVQFTCPHAYLSTATGVAFTARAVGGAFGAAVLTSIINGHLGANYAGNVGSAAIAAGLGQDQVPALVSALRSGNTTLLRTVEGLTDVIIEETTRTSKWTYARAYRKAWASIVPFTVLAIVCVWFLKDIKELMTERVEATVETKQRGPEKQIEDEV
jgi:MFS family permease